MRIAASFVALPVAAAVVWALLRTGVATRLLVPPSTERWHTTATPLGGGIGIFIGAAAGVGAALATAALEPRPELLGVFGGCAILFVAGLVDDMRALNPLAKLATQFLAAGAALWGGLRVEVIGNDVVATVVAVVWLVGMTNAFNLLDNMDGLAASLGGVACLFFALDAFLVNENVTALVLALSIGLACAGFLPFNFRPKKPAAIFMGDSGSQVLGFAVGSLAVYSAYDVAGATLATVAVPLLVLAIPILDTSLVTIVRLLEGRPVSQGGRDHSSHRLVYHGLSEKVAVVLLAALGASVGATSLAYRLLDSTAITVLGVLLTFVALVQFATFITEVERRPPRNGEDAPQTLRRFLVRRRQILEMTVDAAVIGAALLAALSLGLGTTAIWHDYILFPVLPAILLARYATFVPFGLYRGVWRFAGARDAFAIAAAVTVSEVAAFGFLATQQAWPLPPTVFVLDALLCMALVIAARFGHRALDAAVAPFRRQNVGRRTLIVGAGRSGRSLLRELRETRGERVIGFVDDDERLHRRRLQGVPVLGGTDDLERILARTRPDSVLVTIPDAARERLDLLVRLCASADVTCRFVRRDEVDPAVVLAARAK